MVRFDHELKISEFKAPHHLGAVTFPLMNGPTMMVTIHMRKIFYTTLGWLLREKDAHLERIRIPATIVTEDRWRGPLASAVAS